MFRRPRGPITHAARQSPYRLISVVGGLLLAFALLIGLTGIVPAAASEEVLESDRGAAEEAGDTAGASAPDSVPDSDEQAAAPAPAPAPEPVPAPVESIPNPEGALSDAAGPASLAIVVDSSAATAAFRDDWRAGIVGVLDAARDSGKDGTTIAVVGGAQDPSGVQALDPKDPAQYDALVTAIDAALTLADGEPTVPDWQVGLDVVARAQQDGVAQFSDVVALVAGEPPIAEDPAPDGAVAPEGVSDAVARTAPTANAVKQHGTRVLAFAEHAVDGQQALDDVDLEFLTGSIEGAEVPSHTVGDVRGSLERAARALAGPLTTVTAAAPQPTTAGPATQSASAQGGMTAKVLTSTKALKDTVGGYRSDVVNIRIGLFDGKVDSDRGDISDLTPIDPSTDPAGPWRFDASIWQKNATQKYVLTDPDGHEVWSPQKARGEEWTKVSSFTPRASTTPYSLRFISTWNNATDEFNSFTSTALDEVRIAVMPPEALSKEPAKTLEEAPNYQMTCFFNDEGQTGGLGKMVQYKNSGAAWIPSQTELPTMHLQRNAEVVGGWGVGETIAPDAGDIVTCNVVRSHRPKVTLDIDWANSPEVTKVADSSKFKMSVGTWTPAKPGIPGGSWSLPAFAQADVKQRNVDTTFPFPQLAPGGSAYLYPTWRYPQGATKAEPIPFNLDIGNANYVVKSWSCEAGSAKTSTYGPMPDADFQGGVDIAGVVGETAVVKFPAGRDVRCKAAVKKRTESIALWSADRTEKAVWALKPDGADAVSVADCTVEGACSGLADRSGAAGYFMARVPAAPKYTLRETTAPPGFQLAVKANTVTQSLATASPGGAKAGGAVDFGRWTHAEAKYPETLRMTASVKGVVDENGAATLPAGVVQDAKNASKVEIAWKHGGEKTGPDKVAEYSRSAGTDQAGPQDFPKDQGPDFTVTAATIPEGFELAGMICAGQQLADVNGNTRDAGTVAGQLSGSAFSVSFGSSWLKPELRTTNLKVPYNSWDCGITIRKIPPIYSSITVKHSGLKVKGIQVRNPDEFDLTVRAFKGMQEVAQAASGNGLAGATMEIPSSAGEKPDRFAVSVANSPRMKALPVYKRVLNCVDLADQTQTLSVDEAGGVMSVTDLRTAGPSGKAHRWSCSVDCEVGALIAVSHSVAGGPASPGAFDIRIVPEYEGSSGPGRDPESLMGESVSTPRVKREAVAAETPPPPSAPSAGPSMVIPVQADKTAAFVITAKRASYVPESMVCKGVTSEGTSRGDPQTIYPDGDYKMRLDKVAQGDSWECAVTSVVYRPSWSIDLPRAGGVSSDLLLFSGLAVMGSAALLAVVWRRRLH